MWLEIRENIWFVVCYVHKKPWCHDSRQTLTKKKTLCEGKHLLHFALDNWKIHDDYIIYLSIVVRVSIIPKVFVVSKAQLDQS